MTNGSSITQLGFSLSLSVWAVSTQLSNLNIKFASGPGNRLPNRPVTSFVYVQPVTGASKIPATSGPVNNFLLSFAISVVVDAYQLSLTD